MPPLAVAPYAVCVTRAKVLGVLVSLPGIHQRTWLKTLKQSRRTTNVVERGILKLL